MQNPKTHKIRKSFNNKKQLIKHLLDVDSDLEEYVIELDQKKQQNKSTPKMYSFLPLATAVDVYKSETQLIYPISSWINHAKKGFIQFETQFPWLRPGSGTSDQMNMMIKTIKLKTYEIQKQWFVFQSQFDSAIEIIRTKCKQQKNYKKPEIPKCPNCKRELGDVSDPNADSYDGEQRYVSRCKFCSEGCTLYVKDNTPGFKSSDDYPCCKCKKMPE